MAPQLSIVIICCDDPRVLECIDGIDVQRPIIVSLVPNENLRRELLKRGVAVVDSIPGNYSVSCNRGLARVETEWAFIVDSDCQIGSHCIETIEDLLADAPFARARVRFDACKALRFSDRIARLHDGVNNRLPPPAYTPGLGLHLNIVDQIGGYFFDERIFWACDSEMNRRIQGAGLKIAYSEDAHIVHGPISFQHELRSNFKLGMGNRAQAKLNLRPAYESPAWLVRRLLGWMRRWWSAEEGRGRNADQDTVSKLIFWAGRLAYYGGYYRVFFHDPKDIKVDHC